jgi:hypothetical protein
MMPNSVMDSYEDLNMSSLILLNKKGNSTKARQALLR